MIFRHRYWRGSGSPSGDSGGGFYPVRCAAVGALAAGAAASAADHVFAEMSAINPLIILPQAVATRAETLANELVSSFIGMWAVCTKPGLILVLRGEGMSPLHAGAEGRG